MPPDRFILLDGVVADQQRCLPPGAAEHVHVGALPDGTAHPVGARPHHLTETAKQHGDALHLQTETFKERRHISKLDRWHICMRFACSSFVRDHMKIIVHAMCFCEGKFL